MNSVFYRFSSLIFSLIFLTNSSLAQIDRPAVGGWSSYLQYRTVIDFDSKDNNLFYCVSTSSFFTYDASNGGINSYSKANGMHDVNTKFVTYDYLTDQAAIIYLNGNIDLFNGTEFINIPDIKVSTIAGDKTIFDAFANNGFLYISSSTGLIVVDLKDRVIKETIKFYQGSTQGLVKSMVRDENFLYVATDIGLFKTNVNNPQQFNYSTWDKISDSSLNILSLNNNIAYVANEHEVFKVNNSNISKIKFSPNSILNINTANDGNFWLAVKEQNGALPYSIKINNTGNTLDSIPGLYSLKFMDENDGYYWSCDAYYGLRKRSSTNSNEDWAVITANGPFSNGAQNVWAKNGEVWLAHGSKDYNVWFYALNQDAFSRYQNLNWRNWKWDVLPLAVGTEYTLTDALDVVKDEINDEVWIAFFNSGLIKVSKDDAIKLYKWGYLGQNSNGDTARYSVSGLTLDENNNLWITQSVVQKPLRVKTADGNWYSFGISGVNHLASLAIDDYGQKWMAAGQQMNGGLVIYNDNQTIDNPNDDQYVKLTTTEGNGYLTSMAVNTIAKDKNGEMWVGTENGICIFSCAGDIKTSGICNGQRRALVAKGYNFGNYMFENIAVKSIAIDAGNRKWIGTNIGLFLLNDDGTDIIEQFDEANSPLLSNSIKNIDIDPITGVVYISTDKGLCAYGGSAIDAENTVTKPLFTYPNPVPSGYSGLISITGMTENSNVKITDISGQLVYQGTSAGGQFSWNGKDYNGRKVQSGVYLVFVVGKDNQNKATGKFIIHE